MSEHNLDTFTFTTLQQRYQEVLTSNVQLKQDPLPSFLEISGFPHYEDVISNWYAFFFSTTEPHGFEGLFIDTLVEMINESSGKDDMSPFVACKVVRERYVKDKRIDLLLYDESVISGNDETYRNAIIIENKIYAGLYNELNHYYQNITTEEAKGAVVLSIYPHFNLPSPYVNITHKAFLERIMINLGRFIFRASDKYLLLLKDMIQQISLFSKTESMKEYVNFYFEHAVKINELLEIRSKSMDALLNDLNTALGSTPFSWGRRYPESLNIKYSLHDNVLLILNTSKIFDMASYTIELWLTNNLAQSLTDGSLTQLKLSAIPPLDFEFNQKKSGNKYSLLGRQTKVFNRTLQDIEQLPTKIADNLRDQWGPFILTTIQSIENHNHNTQI